MSTTRHPSTHPQRAGIMLLTAFLASATVPALKSWNHWKKGRLRGVRQAHFETSLEDARRPDRYQVAERSLQPANEALWSWPEAPDPTVSLRHELLFPSRHFDLFTEKCALEGRFRRSLDAPELFRPDVTRDGVELRWSIPEAVSALRSELADDPLLKVGFRVYRWRYGEEPRLLATTEVTQTEYQDPDLPLWRDRFSYCVFSVLEGRIGDLPTLIESKRSPVIEVETLENFSLEVLDGSPGQAVVRLYVHEDGEWLSSVRTIHPGDRLTASLETPRGVIEADTGLTIESIQVQAHSISEQQRRPEFLPDGRRKLDPLTGDPTFLEVTSPVDVRTVELVCQDMTEATRTYRSGTLR